MKNKLVIFIGIVGFLMACSNSVDLDKEKEKIREVMNEVSDYGKKGGWENFKNYFVPTEKLQLIDSQMGIVLNGWEEFSAYYKGMMLLYSSISDEPNIKSSTNELVNVNVSQSGEMAWATKQSDWNFDKEFQIWSVLVLEKIDGEWKIVSSFNSSKMTDRS